MPFNEDSRVKMPALLHLTRLGYEYVSLSSDTGIHEIDSNIFLDIFRSSIENINPGSEFNPTALIAEINTLLDNNDLGRSYVYDFIVNHIDDYIDIASSISPYQYDDLCILLDRNFDDEKKIELLKFTTKSVSVRDKDYSDFLTSYILTNHYDNDDFIYLIEKYESYGDKTKDFIINTANKNIDIIIKQYKLTSHSLVRDLLAADSISSRTYTNIDVFVTFAPEASDDNVKLWLPLVKLSHFLPIFDRQKKPRFNNTATNVAILDVFKKRGTITDYKLDKRLNLLSVSRGRLRR